ncbi:hypothetical protein COCMIDRAFT_101295 [Bipolaris oryzae ATCC 44560]|uniref:Uncharacterized protein n=1 Tax=Bipolaris oryzae ATCC 44560 TaxID=930090 RepID=W6Z066_COCMI|nr:uncharacterized protein COCMIDRAFT_101295 [Bipolaris oryzae ATCC 44560]EUC43265.1 hypothetical protein COCMIDRAFT_101295 [Bipolaris oryzae ATCC 44560]
MSLRNEEDFDNYDDYIYHLAGGDAEQASGDDVSSDSEAGSSESAPMRSPPEERDSGNEMDITSSYLPPSSPSYGSSGEEMDTGAFGPTYQSSSDEDSSELSDAPSDDEELRSEEVDMADAEPSPYEAHVAQATFLPDPDPAPANPPAKVAEIDMRDADPAPEPHQEAVEPILQENPVDLAPPKQEEEEEVMEMQASPSPPPPQPSPPPPQPAAPITHATPASPPPTSTEQQQQQQQQPSASKAASTQKKELSAPVANKAIPHLTPTPSLSAERARIQTLLSSLALLNEKSKAFFSRLDVMHAKIEAL